MKIGKQINTLSFNQYFSLIENHDKYSDFNVLGLYRAVVESKKLSVEQKIEIRDYANRFFGKTFAFLQIKDPITWYELSVLGMELTKGDERKIWKEIRDYQEKTLKDKKIKHRSFGTYSKHECGYDKCPYNGVMFRQGSWFINGEMYFHGDRNNIESQRKSAKNKKDRKKIKKLIGKRVEEE